MPASRRRWNSHLHEFEIDGDALRRSGPRRRLGAADRQRAAHPPRHGRDRRLDVRLPVRLRRRLEPPGHRREGPSRRDRHDGACLHRRTSSMPTRGLRRSVGVRTPLSKRSPTRPIPNTGTSPTGSVLRSIPRPSIPPISSTICERVGSAPSTTDHQSPPPSRRRERRRCRPPRTATIGERAWSNSLTSAGAYKQKKKKNPLSELFDF